MVDGAVNTIKIEKAKKTALTCSEKMQLREAKAAAAARMSLTLAKTSIHFNRLKLKKYKGNARLKVRNVGFTYPSPTRKILTGITRTFRS
mmetsp:Transcript_126376/g.218972  ORF Transcript_126376/g.218972 Transcript_126376/m.218972 type:complete len:90 (+) Transcript_126376:982-1251(+)